MDIKQLLLAICLLLGLQAPAIALMVNDLYDIKLPVTDKSSEQQKALFTSAFDELLIRLTGSKKALTVPKIVTARAQVDNYINSFAYDTEGGKQLATIKFSEQGINSLLQANKQQFLGKNRPLVIVWLLEEELGEQKLVVDGAGLEINKLLETTASKKKIPLIVPLLDLTDIETIKTEDIVNGDPDKLRLASQRYNANLILLGKFSKLKSIEPNWSSTWKLFGTSSTEWQLDTGNLSTHINLAMDTVLQNLVGKETALAEHGAVAGELLRVPLNVEGVSNMENYSKILNYLRGLAIVTKVEAMGIDNNRAVFILHTESSITAIANAISLEKVLERADQALPIAEINEALDPDAEINAIDTEFTPESAIVTPSPGELNYRLRK